MILLPEETIRYGPRGRVAHVTREFTGANDIRALCGVAVYTWYGSGSQHEMDRAERLPLCAHCHMETIRRANRSAGDSDHNDA